MRIIEHFRKYAAEQGIAGEDALKKGMEAKSKEFVEKGSELYAKGVKLTLLLLSKAIEYNLLPVPVCRYAKDQRID